MQHPSQLHRRAFGGGTYVAVDPFRPSVSLGIKNIISGQDDPTIDDIPVTRTQTQPYLVAYATQPYTQPGEYSTPYSQTVYATRPYPQPIYPVQPADPAKHNPMPYSYSAPPILQPTYQTQHRPHTYAAPPIIQPTYQTQYRPHTYATQPIIQPTSQTQHRPHTYSGIPTQSQPYLTQSVPPPVIVPPSAQAHRSRPRSWRSFSRSLRARSGSESRRSRRSRRPRRRSRSQAPRRSSLSPERLLPSHIPHQRGEQHHAPVATHGPRPEAHRIGSGEVGSTGSASEVRGRSRSPKCVGSIQGPGSKGKSDEAGSSGFDDSMYSVVSSLRASPQRSDAARLPHSPSPPRDGHDSTRFSPTSPIHSPTSPRFSPISPLYHPTIPHDPPVVLDEGHISAAHHESIPPTSGSSSGSRPQPLGAVVNPPQAPPTLIRPQPVIVDVPPTDTIQQLPIVQQPLVLQPSRSSLSGRSDLRERRPIVMAPVTVIPPPASETPPMRNWPLPGAIVGKDGRQGSPPVTVILPPWHGNPRHGSRSASPRSRFREAPEYSSYSSSGEGIRPPQDEDSEQSDGEYTVQARSTAYAAAFLLDTIPRQIYLHFMLRLPSLYFRRVTRIFEEAEMTMPEIKKMALDAASEWKDPMKDLNRGFIFEPQVVTPPYASLQSSWQTFIDSLMREWKTLNVISVLLLSAILTILQINVAAADPYTRYSALLSLVCALMSLLYGCLYIIRFGTMRKTYKAAEWATEAQKSRTNILWNVWVMLAMPATWLAWSMILYLFCIMSFVWRTGTTDDGDIRSISPRDAFGPRVAITVVFSLGLIYFLLVVTTFRRYGEKMDRAWQQRIWGWAEEKFGYQYVPQIYHPFYSVQPQNPVLYGSSVDYAAQPIFEPASPDVFSSRVSLIPQKDPARPRTPHSARSALLPEVTITLSSSHLQTSPNRTRRPSISLPQTRDMSTIRAMDPSGITVRSSAKSSSGSRERRLSPNLAHIGTTPFSQSRSRSVSPTKGRAKLSSAAQLPSGMAEVEQCFKVLSISSAGEFRWSKPDELVLRGVDDADWTRFDQDATAGWNDKLDTLDNPDRLPPGFGLPQDRLAQVLDWWNTNFFRERGIEATVDQEHTDRSPAAFVVNLLIEGLDRIDLSTPNENLNLEPPDVWPERTST